MTHKRFDIIGDIHGHATQLCQLLTLLGYQKTRRGYHHPDRTLNFTKAINLLMKTDMSKLRWRSVFAPEPIHGCHGR